MTLTRENDGDGVGMGMAHAGMGWGWGQHVRGWGRDGDNTCGDGVGMGTISQEWGGDWVICSSPCQSLVFTAISLPQPISLHIQSVVKASEFLVPNSRTSCLPAEFRAKC